MKNEQDKGELKVKGLTTIYEPAAPPPPQHSNLPPPPTLAICPARDVFRVEGDTRWGLVEQAGDVFLARSRSVSLCHSSPISYGLHLHGGSGIGFGGVCVIVVV